MSRLKIDLGPGEKLRIGDAIVTMEQKSGQRARLVIEADESIRVRKELEPNTSIQLIAKQGLMRTA